MTVKQAVAVALGLAVGAVPAQAQIAGKWVTERCGLKPGHYLVNSGVLYLKDAVESRFADQKQKKLADAERVLVQAVTTGGQQDNPAAWYYLGRYYLIGEDAAGADSAFARAERLRPECADDIDTWRQFLWVPLFNAGVNAWQGGDTDSAIASFRRANAIYRKDPTGPVYLAVLHANADQVDSAIKYFKLGVEIAGNDTAHAEEKRQAMFNLARMYHRGQRWDEAVASYRGYLRTYGPDAEATAALAAVYTAAGNRTLADSLYRSVLDRADSVAFLDLFQAGVAIFRGAPSFPDTAAVGERCRAEARAAALPARRVIARCDSAKAGLMGEYEAKSRETYRLAARAFQAVLDQNPFYRDALYNLTNTYYQLRDTANMLPAAQRLIAVDPLNRTANLLLAQAYQMRAKGDSALHYLQVADSILPIEVNIAELSLEEQASAVGGLITNFHTTPSKPLALVFEFLNRKGDVVAAQTYEVPVIEPEGNLPFRVEAQGAGITAYRYRLKS